jgi:biopolymer transport protein TolR
MRRKAEIDVTPLIDVMLVLPILFMLITPGATRSLEASVPGKSAAADSSRALVLTVDETSYALNRAPAATLTEVDERLREAFRTGASHTVLIEVRGEPRYGRVVEAMDVAQGAGAERLGVLPE